MKFKIPFTFSRTEILRKRAKPFSKNVKYKKDSKLTEWLKHSDTKITREEYIGIIKRSFLINFTYLTLFASIILAAAGIQKTFVLGPLLGLTFSGFMAFSQSTYPKIYVLRKRRILERDLLPALEDILVQLNSGVPLFSVLVNISAADYGELSQEFKKAVRKINAGLPEQEVLEDLSKENSSIFLKRTLWQISNGMKAGSDMTLVVKDIIKALNEEQLIQIQNYGNKLNPLIVFYMLVAVIVPSLSVTFLTILSSMMNISGRVTIMMFIGLAVMVILIQIMFLGLIKSKRPTLL